MSYCDGYVLPVPKRRIAAYKRLAQKGGKIWREHGALHCFESVGDDLRGMSRSTYKTSLRLKPGETAVFAFILFRSRKHRDAVMKKCIKDPRMMAISNPKTVPFDVRRLVYGGFTSIVDL